MHVSVRRVAAAAAGLVLAAVAAVSATPAAAEGENTFEVTHGASGESAQVPRGALLTIITTTPFNDDVDQPYAWTPVVANGAFIEVTCVVGEEPMNLPISYVGRSGSGSRIEVYYPNASLEPWDQWGNCEDDGPAMFLLVPYGDRRRAEVGLVMTVNGHPGLLGAGNSTPKGKHLTMPGGASRPLSECNDALPADQSACPSQTGSVPAELILAVTGSDFGTPCGPPAVTPCNSTGYGASLTPVDDTGHITGNAVNQVLLSVMHKSIGEEEWRVRLNPNVPAGRYKITVFKGTTPAMQDLFVEFGQPT